MDEINIRFTPQQLDAVANALGHRPYIEAAPVIEAIRQQVAEYNDAKQRSAAGSTPSDPLPALP